MNDLVKEMNKYKTNICALQEIKSVRVRNGDQKE